MKNKVFSVQFNLKMLYYYIYMKVNVILIQLINY